MTHNRSRYVKGCRCGACTAANTDYQRRRAKRGSVPPQGSHGLSGYANYGCRCEVCTGAKSAANAAYWASTRHGATVAS